MIVGDSGSSKPVKIITGTHYFLREDWIDSDSHGLEVEGDATVVLVDCTFKKNATYGLRVSGNAKAYVIGGSATENIVGFFVGADAYLSVTDSFAGDNSRHGFLSFQNTGRFSWIGNTAKGNDGSGFVIGRANQHDYASSRWTIASNVAEDNGHNGISIDPRRRAPNDAKKYWMSGSIHNNECIKNHIHGINISRADTVALSDNTVRESGHTGIAIVDSENITSNADKTHDNPRGIALFGNDPDCSNISITGHISENDAQAFVNSSAHANVNYLT